MRLALGSLLAAVAAFVHTSAPASRIVFAADFASKSYGEIYVVSPTGAVTNVSRSPAADTAPAASPDGTQIAFSSARGGQVRIYAVGSNGRGLHAVSPPLGAIGPHDGSTASIVWAPDSRRLAAAVGIGGAPTMLFVSAPWRMVARNVAQAPPAWSQDRKRIAFATATGLVRVVDASGRALWSVGGEGPVAFSQHGLLAVRQSSTTIATYDQRGRQLATIAGGAFAWSPTGDVLATDHVGTLEVRQAGSGKPMLRVKLLAKARPDDDARIEWQSSTRLLVFDNGFAGYDFKTRRRFALPADSTIFNSVLSAAGTVAQIRYGQPNASLVRGGKTVATIPACGDDLPFEGVQFLGRTNALVYQSGCPTPAADIYSIAPDGTGLQQLTKTPQHETSPSLSADGSRVAYVQMPSIPFYCRGCAESIWATNPTTQLTTPKDTDTAPFDDSPSWSPDGTQIAFARSGPDSPYALMTVSAAGGAAKPLGITGSRPVWGPKLLAFEADGTPPKLETYDPVTHAVTVVATTKGLDPLALAWSNDGRLAYLSSGGRISIVGGASFELSKLLPRRSIASGLAWSPDGARFAVVATDANGIGEVYTVGVDGKGLQSVTTNVDAVGTLSWR